jgi:hypothetical protein
MHARPSPPARPVGIAAEFNGWDWRATPFVLIRDRLVATVALPAGPVRFRYRSGDGGWFTDADVEEHCADESGGVDWVVTIGSRALRAA